MSILFLSFSSAHCESRHAACHNATSVLPISTSLCDSPLVPGRPNPCWKGPSAEGGPSLLLCLDRVQSASYATWPSSMSRNIKMTLIGLTQFIWMTSDHRKSQRCHEILREPEETWVIASVFRHSNHSKERNILYANTQTTWMLGPFYIINNFRKATMLEAYRFTT